MLTGNLSLDHFEVTAAADNAEIAEKVIRKLRAEMMPSRTSAISRVQRSITGRRTYACGSVR